MHSTFSAFPSAPALALRRSTVLAAFAAVIVTTCLAEEIVVERLADKASGFSAVVVTVPAELNRGFSAIDVPFEKEGDDIRSYWEPADHVVMINGGFFEHDFSPTGLCRIDGKTIKATKSAKLSGFVAIDKGGAISLLTRRDKLREYPTVVQTGPFVIDPGGKMGIRSRSGRVARRTLIGLTKNGDVVIIVAASISLFDLAQAVIKRLPGVERLLNLDGGPSTAFMADGYGVRNSSPVRNYIVKARHKPVR